MSDCETLGTRLGFTPDSDPATPTIPNVCCGRCHKHPGTGEEQPTGFAVQDNGISYEVCCEVFKAWNAAKPARKALTK